MFISEYDIVQQYIRNEMKINVSLSGIVYSHRNWSSLNIVYISQIHLVVVVPIAGHIVIHRILLLIV